MKVSAAGAELIAQVRAATNDVVGFDQYGGDPGQKVRVEWMSDDLNVIRLSNGREYFLTHDVPEEINEWTEIDWFPAEQRGDWDLVQIAKHNDYFEFLHGS